MTVLANNPSTGLGALSAVPAASANGTALGVMPAGAVGCAALFACRGECEFHRGGGAACCGAGGGVHGVAEWHWAELG